MVIIGSHCIGLDYLIGKLREIGVTAKFLPVGSTGGLEAVKRNECDIAGIHLLDEESNTYNQPFLNNEIELTVQGQTVSSNFGTIDAVGPCKIPPVTPWK